VNTVLFVLFKLFSFGILILPGKVRWWVARGLGRTIRFLVPSRNRVTLANLTGGGYDKAEAHRLCIQAWENLGLVAAEFVYYLMGPPKSLTNIARWEGEEYLQQALAHNKGVIVPCAHLGNWELLGAVIAEKYPVVAIAKEQENARFNQAISAARQRSGMQIIFRGTSMKPILSALRRNQPVGFLMDQRGKGVCCRFFGRETEFHSGAATFAVRTGAPVVIARLIRERPGFFRLIFDPPIFPDPALSDEEQVDELTRRIIKRFEEFIRETPGQWLWMHKLWR
jgi:KDO2-lipid IV(A) lauroyltransferase